MEILLQILGFAAAAHLLVDFFQQTDIEFFKQKPFNCNLCTGYWISFIPLMVLHGPIGFLLGALTGVVSEIIYRLFQRL